MSLYNRLSRLRQADIGPLAPFYSAFGHLTLLRRISAHDLSVRYKESLLGPLWAVLMPLAQLAVFTFVFGTIMTFRWGGSSQGPMDLPLNLFAGILVHTFFAEVITRSTAILGENASYIKRVVFPIEILPITVVITACVNMLVSLLLLVVAIALVQSLSAVVMVAFVPLLLMPLVIMLCGLAWFMAATSVYLPDLRHLISPVVALLMFLSPVLFPVSSIPQAYQFLVYLNPITLPVEQLRSVLILGQAPDFWLIGQYSIVAIIVTWLGHAWFAILRRGFADVV